MPDPFIGNADAARYLASFGSLADQKARTHRLYDEAMESRKEAFRAVEEEMYPEQRGRHRPSTAYSSGASSFDNSSEDLMRSINDHQQRRSAKEQRAYIDRMNEEQQERRRRELIEVEKEMYTPHWRLRRQSEMTVDEQQLLKSVYDKPVKRIQKRKAEAEKRKKMTSAGQTAKEQQAEMVRQMEIKERETNFRPAVRRGKDSVPRLEAEGRWEIGPPLPPTSGLQLEDNGKKEMLRGGEYWKSLATPRTVTEKVTLSSQGFSSYTKYKR